ncbi:O-antigen ligase family protein [Bacillus manliponensis]|uniref:O-antigen ligase family protein n=1 Tax=Bacillus manliponensis TaxID=574376 RepID=UPI0035198330
MLGNNSLSNKFENFILIFILLQPIIDLLTSLSIQVLKINTTIGVVFRLFVMALAGVYILLQAREKENQKYVIYLLIVAVVLSIGFINNFFIKSPILLGEELKFLAKSVYPLVMLTCYIFVFKSLKAKQDIYSKTKNYIMYAALVINIVMVVSIATNTDFKSYEWVKLGSRGWFYAGNELGAILAIAFPIVILFSIQKTTSIKKLYFWIPTLLTIFSLFAIGTKVGYAAIVGALAVAVFMCFVQAFMQRKDPKKKLYLLNGLIATVVFAGVLAYTPFSPAFKNIGFHFQILDYEEDVKEAKEKEEGKVKEEPKTEEEIQHQKEVKKEEEKQALIFSGRQLFQQMYKEYYAEAPMSQKLMGMGYSGNFEEYPKLIERDFHDWFYAFGIIGFALMLIPFLYFGIRILWALVTRFKEIFTVKYALLGSALGLALGMAFMSGHVLTAPGVSIYFAVILAYLIVDLEIE